MNTTALTHIPTKEQLDQFELSYPTSQTTRRNRSISRVVIIVLGGFFFLAGTQSLLTALFIAPESWPGTILNVVVVYFFAAMIWLSIRLFAYAAKKQQLESAMIAQFALQNGLDYVRSIDTPPYTGMFFGLGHSRMLTNVIVSRHSDVKFEIGNYTYTTGSGKNQQTHNQGYIRIGMSRNLPQIVLDASSNNVKLFGGNISNLPASFDKSQKMSLEGDFNKYFTLYAPKEYERDALYIFTPDLMALLIDNVSAYDSEIVDNQLFIYSSQLPFKLTDPALLERLFKIVALVGGKTDTQTDRYADEKVGDSSLNEVAAGGKRLRRNVSVLAVIIVIAIVASILIPFILGIVGATQ